MDHNWQSPSAAWASAALCFTTMPVCLFPIAVVFREQRASTKHSSRTIRPRTSSMSRGSTASLSRSFTLVFWLLITACHVGLLIYCILAATETSEDCQGHAPDRGWAPGVRNCFKGRFVSVIDLTEIVLVAVYPVTLLKVYIEIHSSSNAMTKFRRKLVNRAYHLIVLTVGMLTGFLLATTVTDRIKLYILTSSMSPPLRAVHEWGAEWQATSFGVWFAVLVLSAIAALVLTIRLLPHLKGREQSARDSTTALSQNKQQRTSAASSFTKPGSTHSSTSALKLFSTTSVPSLSGPSSPSVTMASARLRGCIRRLWIILLVVAVVLIVNIAIVGMSYEYSIGHATTCVTGWVSCHIITMAFFSAKRIVREAVIARRQLPSEVGVGTVVTEWQETETKSREG